jgi:gas vesicle protein
MNYKRVLVGVAIGSAVAGLGFLMFHPSGKKIRRKAADIGLDAVDKLIDMMRSVQQEAGNGETQSAGRSRAANAVTAS